MPESTQTKVYVGAIAPITPREQLAELAQRNERTLSGELCVAVTRHLGEAAGSLDEHRRR